MTPLADLVFSSEGNKELLDLVGTELISYADINEIARVITKPTFARIARYLIANNDRNGVKDGDARDSYSNGIYELIATLEKVWKHALKKSS